MVLSNKKLKQKLRATVAESVAAKAGVQIESLKELLPPSNSRLSKREKRRKTSSSQPPPTSSNGDTIVVAASGEVYKKKKRKRNEIQTQTQNQKGAASEPLKEEKKLKKKKLKKKLKNKKKKKNKTEDVRDKGTEQPQAAAVEATTKSQENTAAADASTKVYVGGIPYYSTEDDIQAFFEACGTIIEMDCITFPDTGKFKGIAMITFKTEAAAKRALALDGADMGGLFLKIEPYKATRVPISKSADFAPKIIEGYNRVYVGNLSWDITEEDLRKFFSDCKVSSIRFGEDKSTGEFRGFAHVDFSDSLSLTIALQLDQKEVCGRPAAIRCAVPPKKKADNIMKPGSGSEGKKTEVKAEVEIKKAEVETKKAEVEVKKAEVVKSGGKKRRTCYECGVPGHISSECPKKQAVDPST